MNVVTYSWQAGVWVKLGKQGAAATTAHRQAALLMFHEPWSRQDRPAPAATSTVRGRVVVTSHAYPGR